MQTLPTLCFVAPRLCFLLSFALLSLLPGRACARSRFELDAPPHVVFDDSPLVGFGGQEEQEPVARYGFGGCFFVFGTNDDFRFDRSRAGVVHDFVGPEEIPIIVQGFRSLD